MSYRWHSQGQDSFDAIRLTWIAIGTKRKKQKGRRRTQKIKKNLQMQLQIQSCNNKRKEEQLTLCHSQYKLHSRSPMKL